MSQLIDQQLNQLEMGFSVSLSVLAETDWEPVKIQNHNFSRRCWELGKNPIEILNADIFWLLIRENKRKKIIETF